jgi:protein gp37
VKVSPGCKHCYAEVMARRLQAMGAPGYDNGFQLSLLPERLEQPLLRRKPTLYFVNSMSDLFQDGVPEVFIDRVIEVIKATPQHTYQLLTKRSVEMRDYFAECPVPENLWLGVSVEDRKYGVPRIADLKAIRARTGFLSLEPLLEDLGPLHLSGIRWVIVGGESGHGARPMSKDWVVRIRDQCEDTGVEFFFKQWGAWGPDGIRRNKKVNGRLLEGQVWDRIPVATI